MYAKIVSILTQGKSSNITRLIIKHWQKEYQTFLESHIGNDLRNVYYFILPSFSYNLFKKKNVFIFELRGVQLRVYMMRILVMCEGMIIFALSLPPPPSISLSLSLFSPQICIHVIFTLVFKLYNKQGISFSLNKIFMSFGLIYICLAQRIINI